MHASVAHAPRRVRCESGSSIKFASVCIVDSATKRGLLLLARTAAGAGCSSFSRDCRAGQYKGANSGCATRRSAPRRRSRHVARLCRSARVLARRLRPHSRQSELLPAKRTTLRVRRVLRRSTQLSGRILITPELEKGIGRENGMSTARLPFKSYSRVSRTPPRNRVDS